MQDIIEISRFTPTLVGKTLAYLLYCLAISVHPHACGENSRRKLWRAVWTVHPHACGENSRSLLL